jgi:transcriptional regulator with PAS, ATPase and Fis domain
LAEFFIEKLSRDLKRDPAELTESAVGLLENYRWPGNVRELRNILERVLILEDTRELRAEHLPIEIHEPGTASGETSGLRQLPPGGLRLEDIERDLIRQALARTQGNITRAARLLGISRDTLRYRLTKFPNLVGKAVREPDSRE